MFKLELWNNKRDDKIITIRNLERLEAHDLVSKVCVLSKNIAGKVSIDMNQEEYLDRLVREIETRETKKGETPMSNVEEKTWYVFIYHPIDKLWTKHSQHHLEELATKEVAYIKAYGGTAIKTTIESWGRNENERLEAQEALTREAFLAPNPNPPPSIEKRLQNELDRVNNLGMGKYSIVINASMLYIERLESTANTQKMVSSLQQALTILKSIF